MANITLLVACFMALLAFSSAFQTTITTTVVEEESQSCQQEIQQQQQLFHCKMYLTQGRQSEQISLRTFGNPQWEEEHLNDCCRQLGGVSPPCRCRAISQLLQQAQQQMGRYGSEEMQEMVQKAQSLPQQCKMEPKWCQIRAVFF